MQPHSVVAINLPVIGVDPSANIWLQDVTDCLLRELTKTAVKYHGSF